MFCTNCGNEIKIENKYCCICGARIANDKVLHMNEVKDSKDIIDTKNVIKHNQEKSFYIVNWVLMIVIGVIFFGFPLLTEYQGSDYDVNMHIYHIPGCLSEIENSIGLNLDGGGVLLFLTISLVIIAVLLAISMIILFKNMVNYEHKKIIKWSKIFSMINIIALGGIYAWMKLCENYTDTGKSYLFDKYRENEDMFLWTMNFDKNFDVTVFFWIMLVIVLIYRFLVLRMYNKIIKQNICNENFYKEPK